MDPRVIDFGGGVREYHRDADGFVDYVVDRPVGGLPELIWIIDDRDRFVVADDSDESSAEEESEDYWTPNEDDWRSTSEDSGYSSLEDDEEDLDDGNEEDIQPRSPLVMRFHFSAAVPHMAGPAAAPAPPPGAPALHMRSFPKRPPEDSDVEAQVGTKRQRTSEEDDEQPGPSTSGAPPIAVPPVLHICSFPKRPREESDVEAQVGTKRQRTSEEDNEQPGPSTPGTSSTTNRSTSSPSPSDLSFSVMSGNWFRPFWSPDDSDSD